MPDATILAAEQISHVYASPSGDVPALNAVTLGVARESFVCLVGPSGCGKSTLLRILAGLLQPSEGRALLDGQPITRAQRRIGVVFQKANLLPWRTVYDNLVLPLELSGLPPDTQAERAAGMLELTGLTAFADAYPAELSGGMAQRVAIGRALIYQPEVLLLDEPFNALDAKLRLAMQVELRKLIDRVGITAIFVTHDQAEAMTLSDTVAVMRAGRIEQADAPLRLYDRPATAYVAAFIGGANLLPVRVAGGRVQGWSGIATARPDGPALLVVRPETIGVRRADGEEAGWSGRIVFAAAHGPTTEYEIDAGAATPVRAVVPRRAGEAPLPSGTRVALSLTDPEGCTVIAAETADAA